MSLDFTWTRLPGGMIRIDYARGGQPAGYTEIALINELETLQDQIISVLGEFLVKSDNENFQWADWLYAKAKPLLDNLKALKKEGTE